MDIAIKAFENFTDLDLLLPWDLLNRIMDLGWRVLILGDKPEHRSLAGLTIPRHGPIQEANEAGVVLLAIGPTTRQKYVVQEYLQIFRLDPGK